MNPQRRFPSLLSFFIAFTMCMSLLPVVRLARAQTETTGAVEGRVTNSQTGEGLGGINVEIENQDTKVTFPVRTKADGGFVKTNLQPGLYNVRVNTEGFEPFRQPIGVYITRVRRVIPLPISLVPLARIEPTPTPIPGNTPPPATPTPLPTRTPEDDTQGRTVTGTEDTDIRAEINNTDARRDGSYSAKEVSTLPLGATTLVRTFDELALLLPGVAPPPQTLGSVAGPGVGAGVGSAGQFAVNGLRSRANNFTVDGSDNNDEDIGVRRQGFLALVPQPIESVQEYQVITLLAPAQYGRNFGAQVNAVSRSGGNETHGTFFGFLNTSQLNSRDFFDTANGNSLTPLTAGNNQRVLLDGVQIRTLNESGGEDSFTLGQGGFVLGGPLVPERNANPGRSLFYFISAEGHILNATKEASFAVPTVEERGTFRSGASGLNRNPITGEMGAFDFYFPTSLQGDSIFSLFPFPNNPQGIYDRNTFTQTLPAGGQSKILSGKADGNFRLRGRQQQITARYNFTDDFRDIPVTGGAIFSTLRPNVRTQNFSSFLNSEVSDTISNQLRLSYGRTRLTFEEVRNQNFLIDSNKPFNAPTPFLLNARRIENITPPQCSVAGINLNACVASGGRIVGNTGDVRFISNGTTERGQANTDSFIEDGAIGPVGQVIIAGFSPIGVDVFNFPQQRVNNTYQIADTLNVRAGRHSFAFGTDIRRTELNSALPRNSRTLINFNGAPRIDPNTLRFNGFISGLDLAGGGAASGTFQTLIRPGVSNSIGLRYYQLYFFGQDEWRVRPNLSLSYGLRYEYNTSPQEVSETIERSFSSPDLNLIPNLRRFIGGRTEIFEADRNNFAPRIGFAYSPRPSTIIRAGYGLFYDQVIGAVVSQSRNVYPNFLTLNTGGGIGAIGFVDGSNALPTFDIFNTASPTNGINLSMNRGFFPYTSPGTLNSLNRNLPLPDVVAVDAAFNGGTFGITLPARDVSTPEAQHYSVTFEQQLGSNMVASVAYVGTQGRHLLRSTTPNLGPNRILLPVDFDTSAIVPVFAGIALNPGVQVTSDGRLVINPDGSVRGRPTPGVGAVNIYETSANSRYDALQVQLRGRYARGLQYQAQYTFSNADDDVSDVFDLAGASALPQNSLTRAGERADANFDVRHRFSYNLLYSIPQYQNRDSFLRFLLDGLEVASTGQFQTGQPFTVNSIFDVNLDGNLTDRLNSTSGITQTGNRRAPLQLTGNPMLAPVGQDGSIPRNSFRAGNFMIFNLAVSKNFRLTEQQAITFRTEFFNLTDRDNFGIPVRFLEAPGFGRSTDTVTPGRRIQFALKYSF